MNSPKPHIGSHIRKLRKLQQQTLQNVADTCGYTKSLLSKIEGGKVMPPIATLVKIASALNTNIAALMAEGDNIDCIFVPAKQKGVEPVPTESGYSIFPLAVELKKKKMQPFIFTVQAEDLNDKVHSHLGEEFIYMLEGKMEFQVGTETYRLKPGDSLFFESARDHRILNVLSAKVKYLDIFN